MIPERQHNVQYLASGAFAMNRYRKYDDSVLWSIHSEYKGFEILCAYHMDNLKPCGLYGFWVEMDVGIFVVSDTLVGIKAEVTKVKEGKA